MDSATLPLLLPVTDDAPVFVNDQVLLRDFDGVRVVLVGGHLFYRYALGSKDEEVFVIGTLAHAGLARQVDLARAFGVSTRSVRRYGQRVEEEGARGALAKKRGPKGPHTVTRSVRNQVKRLKQEGLSNRAVGRRLGISERSVRRVLEEVGYAPPEAPRLPGLEVGEEPSGVTEEDAAPCEEQKTSTEGMSLEDSPEGAAAGRPVAEAVPPRILERTLARFGGLSEAPPEVESGRNLRCAGVLLAVPAIVELGTLDIARSVYRGLRPGFYGLQSFVMTLLFMALLRIKRPEGLKELPPEVLGRHLGLDRSPEVKTVRRKLTEIARKEKSHAFLTAIARRLAAENEELLGFLYVDGHVRAYHGKRPREKTFVPRKRICMPATTDYWVNDAGGDPFFFVTTEAHGGLAKVLPGLLTEVKGLIGEGRKTTVVFDRGGWRQEVLRRIRDELKLDFITYRRKPFEPLLDEAFTKQTVVEDGRQVDYVLADKQIELGCAGEVRLVVRKDEKTGEQIHIVTTRRDLSAVEVVLRMVSRWRQENYFKYAREEFALDAMVSYELVPAAPDRLVVNPKRREIDRDVGRQRTRVKKLEQEIVSKSAKEEGRPTLAGFKAALYDLGQRLEEEKKALARLLERRSTIPRRVTLGEARDHEPMRLEFERKTFTDTLKMMAYRTESGLVAAIAPHYRRAKQEGRKLIRNAMRAAGDVEIQDGEMCVTLEPMSYDHQTKALRALCDTMNGLKAKYPGTSLVLRFGVREA